MFAFGALRSWTRLVWQGHADAAETLLRAGADPHAKATSGDEDTGKTALRIATEQGHAGEIVALLRHAAARAVMVGRLGGGGAKEE